MPKPRGKGWAYGIATVAAACAIFLGSFIVETTGELEEVKVPLAMECVQDGAVYNALRQVCEQIVDETTPGPDTPVVPPESPVERFPLAPAVPVPQVTIPGPVQLLPAPPAQTSVLPGPPQQTVTLAAPPPETVTQPAPPPETVTVTQPPETVTVTGEAPPPETVTETATATETVTETTGPPPIIDVPN